MSRDKLAEARDRLVVEDDDPTDLPEAPGRVSGDPLAKFRHCKKCGVEGRVVSNSSGVKVICPVCKDWWQVSGSRSPDKRMPLTAPRGLSKQTRVTPDVSIAFEPDEE